MSEIKKHMNEKTLKFCPCCNGIAILDESEAQIRCIDCGLTMDITKCFSIGGSWKEAVEEAVTKWNTRKQMERILTRLEEEKSDWNDDYNVPIKRAIEIVKEEGGIE